MANLMTKTECEARIQAELRDTFPWVGAAVLKVPPGLIPSAAEFLTALQEIAGLARLRRHLKFLRLAYAHDGAVTVGCDISGLTQGQRESIAAAEEMLESADRHFCPGCGVKIASRKCKAHYVEHQQTLFAEDASALNDANSVEALAQFGQPEIVSGTGSDEIGLVIPVAAETGDKTVDLPAPSNSRPMVQVFDPGASDAVMVRAKGKDRESRDRLETLAKKIAAASPIKPIATIPEDYEVVIDMLRAKFPNFEPLIDYLHDQFALSALGDRRLAIDPILLDGPPGIGKTEIAMTLADELGVAKAQFDLSAMQTPSKITGSDAHWANTQEGELFETLVLGPTANPVVVLDELDKMATKTTYPMEGPLHALLERRTARCWSDLSVPDVRIDASYVLWFATSNEVDRLSDAIRSRFNTFQIKAPDREQTLAILSSIYQNILAKDPWGSEFSPELPKCTREVLSKLSPRRARVLLTRALGRAARAGRRELQAHDIVLTPDEWPSGKSIGFIRN